MFFFGFRPGAQNYPPSGPKITLFGKGAHKRPFPRAQNYPMALFFVVLGLGPKITPITKIYTPATTPFSLSLITLLHDWLLIWELK